MKNQSKSLFPFGHIASLAVETSKSSARKYPNVMWFPRSKTDPQEIREVLKTAFTVQKENNGYFNDKLLGEYMAKIGSINIVGMLGDEYIESYKGKSTGDVSYITNARMLMRFFRFLGLVKRIEKAKYQLTELGEIYCNFSGDFPSRVGGEEEEQMLLYSLASFAFYSVNDDSTYRDATFQIRPFISLLNTLEIEPQCIYQLIVTAFAAKKENTSEIKRISQILENLQVGKTTLEKEFENLGLDAGDYSCVHNFYDSAKILVYIGTSLGLIEKTSNPSYGKKIAGRARHLKQASTFYLLTEKGRKYLEEHLKEKLIYYSDLYEQSGNESILQLSFILAALNMQIGSKKTNSIHTTFFKLIFGDDWEIFIEKLKTVAQIEIDIIDNWVTLNSQVSFNFFQSIPPEFLKEEPLKDWFDTYTQEFKKENSNLVKITTSTIMDEFAGKVVSRFILDGTKNIYYSVPALDITETQNFIKYPEKDNVFGGQDRFSSRISPTNSVLIVGDKVHIDNEQDCLDLLVPLRHPDNRLRQFISANLLGLIKNFLSKSDTWTKDQHYVWVRNCFRLLGAEAIYSGSGGMLSRADISVVEPFIGGVEAKSPSENRGSINTKAIRQAFDAKVQVGYKFPEKKHLPRAAIAIGRRITPLAIQEEKKYRSEGNPVLLISDAVLYYLTLRTIELPFQKDDVVDLFTKNEGVLSSDDLKKSFEAIIVRENIKSEIKAMLFTELDNLAEMIYGPK